MEIKKAICVSSIGGRTGSSLTMGLLGQSGIDVGSVANTASPHNQKGFFEIPDYWKELYAIFPHLGKPMQPIKPLLEICHSAREHHSAFMKNMQGWFTEETIAIKTPFFIPRFLLGTNIRTVNIRLKRDINSQAASIKRVNPNMQGDIRSWLREWENYADFFFASDLTISFEDWITNPYETYEKLCEIVQPPVKLSKEQVEEWVDPKLVTS